ncbi:hypothetical protein U1Q18_023364 [Sarracenia purpurea var. burkii]
MSVSSPLLLFLLCISFHACNARGFGAIGNDDPEKKFLLPNKNDEKVVSPVRRSVVAPKFKTSLSSTELGAVNGGINAKKSRVDEDDDEKDDQNPKVSKPKELIKGQGAKISGGVPSVSWRLPRRKRGGAEQQPEFNQDYSPPKTHPPVHN